MDFEFLICFAIALIPGIFWLFVLALRYQSDRESRLRTLKIFLLGMIMCTPAGAFNTFLISALGADPERNLLKSLVTFLLVVGPNEEGMKFLIVWTDVYRGWRFRTELDGIIFASASALGFATYENAVYMQQHGMYVLLSRAWACTLGHMSFSAIFGYYMGLAKSKKYAARPCIAEGLVLAALFHGFYDLAVGISDIAIYIVVPLLVLYYMLLRRNVLVPYLSIVAPRWMEYQPIASSAISFQRRRFPQLTGVADKRVREALAALSGMEDEERLRGLELSRGLYDQRLFEKVQQLVHDPVEAVRFEADVRHRELKRQLRTTGPTE